MILITTTSTAIGHVYAANLWKVFLYYAVDLNNRSPALQLPFPEAAKVSICSV